MQSQIKPLDSTFKAQIEALPHENSQNIFHGVDSYGMRGLAHMYLMHQAQIVVDGKQDFQAFKNRFTTGKTSLESGGKPVLSLTPLIEQGIYVTPFERNVRCFQDVTGYFIPFEGDLRNALMGTGKFLDPKKREEYRKHRNPLIKKSWAIEEFIVQETIDDTKKFGKSLLDITVARHNYYASNPWDLKDQILVCEDELALGKALIEHYQSAADFFLQN